MNCCKHLLGLLAAAGFWLGAATMVWSAPPTLTHLFPAGGQRGTKLTVTCTGNFTWPTQISAPGLEVTASKESGKLEVTIPGDLAADRVWIRLFNSEGASSAMPFLIDNLKEIAEAEPNDETRTPQELSEAAVVVNGILSKNADVDCFALKLKSGDTLVAAVDANTRLSSPMDAILQVVSPEGHVLAENNDHAHLDPRLEFTARKSGTYVARVFAFSSTPNTSIRLSNSSNYIYRLTLTTGPYVSHAIPLAASGEKPADVELRGWNLPANAKAIVAPFGGKSADQQERLAKSALRLPTEMKLGYAFSPRFGGGARVGLTNYPAISVLDAKTPTQLAIPAVVTGCLRQRRQKDEFRVTLKSGQAIVASVETNSLGFHCDPALQLTDSQGKVVANAIDIGPDREAMLAYSATSDGTFVLSVRDRFSSNGDRSYYRLTVRPDEPDFELSLSTESVVVSPGKSADVPIKIQRRGSIGPISIGALDPPTGVTVDPVVSEPKGPTASAVTLKIAAKGPEYSGTFRIRGVASQPKLERLASTAPRLGATFDAIWLTVVDKK